MNEELLKEWLNPNSGFFYRQGSLLEKIQTPYQLLEVYDTPQFGKLFRLDGYFMTSEKEEFFYHENIIHPAAITHPGPQRALVIGGGDAGSSEELLKYPTMESVIMAELDEKVVDISKKYLRAVHHDVFSDPRLKVNIMDGFKYLRETKDRFDLIVLDLTDPIGPAAELYTAEFYATCHRALSTGGALTLHIGSPIFRPDLFQGNIEKLSSVFKIVRPYVLYIPLYGALWGMACASDTLDPITIHPQEIDARLRERRISHLRYYNSATHHAVFALPNFVRDLTKNGRAQPQI